MQYKLYKKNNRNICCSRRFVNSFRDTVTSMRCITKCVDNKFLYYVFFTVNFDFFFFKIEVTSRDKNFLEYEDKKQCLRGKQKKLCSDTGSYYPLTRVDFFYNCECALVIINIIV